MTIYCTVTNDLSYDQRMIRIATSLSSEHTVTLVGRKLETSIPLTSRPFGQKRIKCFFSKGKLFYAEYNTRLFLYLLFKKMDCICAVDLDTILPCYYISRVKKIIRVFDAHELFCEMKEVVSRPAIYNWWKRIEKNTVPAFKYGYTVSDRIAEEYKQMYGSSYIVIRNLPIKKDITIPVKNEKYLLYQGAVNEGRCFEYIIPAMNDVNAKLVICGTGNFYFQAQKITEQHGLQEKIIFKGNVEPSELATITLNAWAGINLLEDVLNNRYSLANRFFDYINGCIPQLCIDLPGYREINEQYEVALLTSDISPGNISAMLNRLLEDEEMYYRLQQNCIRAREIFNWQHEEKKLLGFYRTING